MVINKTKSSKKDSKTVVSEIVQSSSTNSAKGEGGKTNITTTTTTQQLPILQEKLVQKSSSSNMVTKSSSSTKVSQSSSSKEQKFYSTSSSSMTSGSSTNKTGKTQQLQLQSNDFLRGERMHGDIDSLRSKDGSVLIESVDLHNLSGDYMTKSNLDNLVSIEIESKDSRAASSSTNKRITNTLSTSGDGNRNDVITVESGRKVMSGDTTMSTAVSSDVYETSSSHFQGHSSATSSSNYQEYSNIDGVIDSKATQSSASKNVNSLKIIKDGQVVNNKNVADTTTTFTSKVFDDKTKTWVVVGQSSVNETDVMMLPGLSSNTQTNSIDGGSKVAQKVFNDKTKTFEIVGQSTINETDARMLTDSSSNIRTTLIDGVSTVTSKFYDDKTKTWKIVDQSTVNESNISNLPSSSSTVQTTFIDGTSSSVNNNDINTVKISSSSFDSKNSKVDSLNTSSKMMSSDIQTSSTSNKEILEKNMSSKKESYRDEKFVNTSTKETMQVFDTKTKTWKNVDSSSINQQRRPSYVRYLSQNDDGTWHTIYKRKLYDQFSKQWRIVEEKVVKGDDIVNATDIPQLIENSSNITTTTYTTKLYDTKTGKWTIVEEKSFVDTEPVNVTQDIKREFEKDEADLANVITTTETTKVILTKT
jgi:hypothetical protein